MESASGRRHRLAHARQRRLSLKWQGNRSSLPIDDPAAIQIVGGDFNKHTVAGHDADEVFAHLAADMCKDQVPVLEFYAKRRVGKRFDDHSFDFDCLFFSQKIPQSNSRWPQDRRPARSSLRRVAPPAVVDEQFLRRTAAVLSTTGRPMPECKTTARVS